MMEGFNTSTREVLETVEIGIKVGGEAGQGIQTIGAVLSKT